MSPAASKRPLSETAIIVMRLVRQQP